LAGTTPAPAFSSTKGSWPNGSGPISRAKTRRRPRARPDAL
jgi:hypothetical protein